MTSEELNLKNRVDECWKRAVDSFNSGDKATALFLLKSLAKDGVEAAYREIANIYEQPSGGGVEQDFEKAREWYQKSIDLAEDVRGCIGLGRIYYYGKGCPRQPAKAFGYYSMVSDKDIPEIHIMLGRMYSLGRGVAKDADKAVFHYRKAIESGNLVAMKDLALHKIANGELVRGYLLWIYAALKIIKEGLVNPKSIALRSQ